MVNVWPRLYHRRLPGRLVAQDRVYIMLVVILDFRDFFDGRWASQSVKEHVFDQSGIRECTIFSDTCTLQLSRHVFQAMTGPIGIEPACEIKDIHRAIRRPPKTSQGHHQRWEDEVRSSPPGISVSNWISHSILAFDGSVRAGSRVTITFRRTDDSRSARNQQDMG